jgi:hypothetical protein
VSDNDKKSHSRRERERVGAWRSTDSGLTVSLVFTSRQSRLERQTRSIHVRRQSFRVDDTSILDLCDIKYRRINAPRDATYLRLYLRMYLRLCVVAKFADLRGELRPVRNFFSVSSVALLLIAQSCD